MDKRFAIPGVTARTPLSEAAPALLRAKARPLFDLESAARSGADMDAVHDMRVASRRLREAMRLLEPLYPQKQFKTWYRGVRAVTRALGPVRDSDVFVDAFARLAPELGEGGKRCVAFMVGYHMGQRERELEALNKRLSTLDLEESRRSFEELVSTPAESAHAQRTLADFAHAEVAARAAVVFGSQSAALQERNIAQQHRLRIDYKRLRYAAEAFATCYGDAFVGVHQTLTAFQDALGELHDLHVFLDMVREPERVAAAARAGVSAADIAEVEALLVLHAHEAFARFTWLAEGHKPERLLPRLLLPLAKSSAPEPADRTAPESQQAEHEPPRRPLKPPKPPTPPPSPPEISLFVEFVDEPEAGS